MSIVKSLWYVSTGIFYAAVFIKLVHTLLAWIQITVHTVLDCAFSTYCILGFFSYSSLILLKDWVVFYHMVIV